MASDNAFDALACAAIDVLAGACAAKPNLRPLPAQPLNEAGVMDNAYAAACAAVPDLLTAPTAQTARVKDFMVQWLAEHNQHKVIPRVLKATAMLKMRIRRARQHAQLAPAGRRPRAAAPPRDDDTS